MEHGATLFYTQTFYNYLGQASIIPCCVVSRGQTRVIENCREQKKVCKLQPYLGYSKIEGVYHYQRRIRFHSPYSSDVVPDSTIQSDSNVGPDYNANESDESELAAECSGHRNHKTVAYLAASKMQTLDDNEQADLVTALMEWQVAEDAAARVLQKIVTISPDMKGQMVQRIQEWLNVVEGGQRKSCISFEGM